MKEKLIAVNLDAKNKSIGFEVIAIGSVLTIFARPIKVFKTAILINNSNIVLVHNHPSGEPRPNGDDIAFIKKIKRISDDLGLRFCDHIIISINNYYTFANEGLIFTEKINEADYINLIYCKLSYTDFNLGNHYISEAINISPIQCLWYYMNYVMPRSIFIIPSLLSSETILAMKLPDAFADRR